jgi:hypothetical protein
MEYPRVTEILRPFTGYESVPKQVLEKAAVKGTVVHAWCAQIAKGHWVPDGVIAEELLGYVTSFRKWAEAQATEFVVIEKRYSDDFMKYSGQVDYVIVGSDSELYLVDIKTSSKPQRTYPVQMAAYCHLLSQHGTNVKGAMLVYLNKEGEFPEIDMRENLEEEFEVFICARDCWRYFNKRKGDARRNFEDECVPTNARDNVGTGLHTKGIEESQRTVCLCEPRSSDSSTASVPG